MAGHSPQLAAVPAPARRGPAVGRAFLVSLANQGVASGGNFVLNMYLARAMSLEQFGVYGLCYGACMLYIGVGNAVLLTQMTVSMADRADTARSAFAGRTLCGVLLMGALLMALALAAALLLAALRVPHWQVVPLTALAAAAMLCAEFFVSHAYLQRHERAALLVNCLTIATLGAGMGAQALLGQAPSAVSALLCYALGAALASAAAYARQPLALRHARAALRDEWLAAWRHGRWALGGVGVTWVQAQSATYALALVLGPAGAGLANIGRLFISPFSFLLPAINKVALPRLAALRASEPRRMRRLAGQLTLALVLLALAYAALLLLSLDWLAPLVLGQRLPQLAPMVTLWCLVLVAQLARSGGAQLMQMQFQFRALTLLNLPSAALAVGAALVLMHYFAHAGAVAGQLAGELLFALLIWKEIRHAGHAA